MGIDLYNCEKYLDPTAYEALSNISKEERNLRAFRPIVYICSPYAGDAEANIIAARKYSRFAVDNGCLPIAPHLLYPQFLNNNDSFERMLSLRFGVILLDKCAEIWVFGPVNTPSMQEELNRARRKCYTVRYFNTDCKEVGANGGGGDTWTKNRL